MIMPLTVSTRLTAFKALAAPVLIFGGFIIDKLYFTNLNDQRVWRLKLLTTCELEGASGIASGTLP
jgi:hypothetical protein